MTANVVAPLLSYEMFKANAVALATTVMNVGEER